MTRGYLINHLIEQECYPDDSDVPGVGQLWHNFINGEVCYVPYEDELVMTTYCHIFYELKIDPPKEHGYDSDYAVYTSFREEQLKHQLEPGNNKNGN